MGIFHLYDKVTAGNWGQLVCKIKTCVAMICGKGPERVHQNY